MAGMNLDLAGKLGQALTKEAGRRDESASIQQQLEQLTEPIERDDSPEAGDGKISLRKHIFTSLGDVVFALSGETSDFNDSAKDQSREDAQREHEIAMKRFDVEQERLDKERAEEVRSLERREGIINLESREAGKVVEDDRAREFTRQENVSRRKAVTASNEEDRTLRTKLSENEIAGRLAVAELREAGRTSDIKARNDIGGSVGRVLNAYLNGTQNDDLPEIVPIRVQLEKNVPIDEIVRLAELQLGEIPGIPDDMKENVILKIRLEVKRLEGISEAQADADRQSAADAPPPTPFLETLGGSIGDTLAGLLGGFQQDLQPGLDAAGSALSSLGGKLSNPDTPVRDFLSRDVPRLTDERLEAQGFGLTRAELAARAEAKLRDRSQR